MASTHTGAMAYDEQLAERLREAVAREPGITEKRMFGGVAVLADEPELQRWLAIGIARARSLPAK